MPKKKVAVRDKFYTLAKEGGYRARSAFKLVQLNRKYMFLEDCTRAIDLCAAPGGWLQVLEKSMPNRPDRQIIGVDLLPIKPIPNCVTFQADITTAHCHTLIRHEMRNNLADVVLCDGAPNVGSAFNKDAFVQADLALAALKFATEHLRRGGTFITKVFRSADSNALMWAFSQLFQKVEATKPTSSRNVSAEIFVVCRQYVKPDSIDPRLLDSKYVFAQVGSKPLGEEEEEKKMSMSVLLNEGRDKYAQKRFRDGYDEDLLSKAVPAMQFIESDDPVRLLVESSAFTFDAEKEEELMELTSQEILALCADLKVIGKADFKLLAKWRLNVRKVLKLEVRKSKQALAQEKKEEDEDEEAELGKALLSLEASRKKEEKKQRKIASKLQTKKDQGMIHPFAIEVNAEENDTTFSLRALGLSTKDERLDAFREENADILPLPRAAAPAADDLDEEEDSLEKQLELDYQRFAAKQQIHEPMSIQDRRRQRTAEKGAKQKKSTLERLTEEDFQRALKEAQEDAYKKGAYAKMLIKGNDGNEDDSQDEDEEDIFTPAAAAAAAKKWKPAKSEVDQAQIDRWYQQSMFQEVADDKSAGGEFEDIKLPSEMTDKAKRREKKRKEDDRKERRKEKKARLADGAGMAEKKSKMEIVPFEETPMRENGEDDNDDDDMVERKTADPKMKKLIEQGMGKRAREDANAAIEVVKNVDYIQEYDSDAYDSDERATHLALGGLLAKKSTRGDLLESAYNRYAFNDDALPVWFAEDEARHNRPFLPITKEMIDSVKSRFSDVNDRPIKKVAEARLRKQKRAQKKVADAKRKANSIVDEPDMSSRSKMKSIEKLFNNTEIKRPGAVYVVSQKGGTKKASGGKGTKGKRVKVVDARMKKDMRKSKKAAKKKH